MRDGKMRDLAREFTRAPLDPGSPSTMPRLNRTIGAGPLLFVVLVFATTLHFKSQSQVQVPPALRAQRDTWTPLMDVLKDKRPRVTDEQLERLRNVSIEDVWGAIQSKGYQNTRTCFVTH